jgi:hypothetical protein
LHITFSHRCSYTADLVWIGKKPRFSDASSSCYSSEEDNSSEDESEYYEERDDSEYESDEEDGSDYESKKISNICLTKYYLM